MITYRIVDPNSDTKVEFATLVNFYIGKSHKITREIQDFRKMEIKYIIATKRLD